MTKSFKKGYFLAADQTPGALQLVLRLVREGDATWQCLDSISGMSSR